MTEIMAEKRFEWDNVDIAIRDNQNRKKYWIDITCIDEVVDLLNELNDERERYKFLAEQRRTEIIRRVATLQNIVEKYTSGEILFKNDVNPNRAVESVLQELLNTQIE